MEKPEKSLRMLIEKWFAPTPATPIRITRFSRRGLSPRGYICVEASRSAGPLAIFFFRHNDGAWCLFPPESERPAMNVSSGRSTIEVSAGRSNARRV
nr:hypothetical protein [Paraburkholderia dipogonis]